MQQNQPQLPEGFVIQLPAMPLDDVNKILAGLGYLPHRDVDHLLMAIKATGDQQVAAALSAQMPAPDEQKPGGAANDGQ